MVGKQGKIYNPGTQQIFIGISIQIIHELLLFHIKHLLLAFRQEESKNVFCLARRTILTDCWVCVEYQFPFLSWVLSLDF